MAKLTRPRPKRRPPAEGMAAAPSPKPTEGNDSDAMTPEERVNRLQMLADSLCKTRTEAINGRKASGIEDIWREDEEHYEGIDDANRATAASANASKPPGMLPPNAVTASTQSTEFPNITQPYVDAAAARVGDILLPTDAKGWSIKETPIPELLEKAKGGLPVEVIEGMAALKVDEQTALKVAQTEQEAAQAALDEAKAKAKRAEKRIEDWQVESQFHGELRQAIDDAARIGTGVVKGPMPAVKRQQMYRDGALIIEEVKKPVSKRLDAWNCFPDPACGQSIHNGRYHWERDYITAKQLEALKRDESYIAPQIDACLTEGPKKKTDVRQLADGRTLDEQGLFEIWYFCGYATREDMLAAGCACPGHRPVMIPAVFTMVNDRVIKGDLNHLDTGEFPYDYFPWHRRKNSPWGLGVGRKIRTAQRIVTAATRVMLTNAGRAAGPMVIMKRGVVGADGNNNILPWKVFYASKDDTTDDVNKLMRLVEIPALTDQLMKIVQFGLKMAEDTTGLPLLLQGQAGSAPETLGGQQLVDRNATGVLRRIARTFDDCITEPHIRRYYVYLLMYGPEDIEKGEFVIDAKGSTALVEREINRQEAANLLEASLNPAFGLDPKKTMEEKLRADNRNPKDFQLSDEDQQKLAQQPPQPAPVVEAAKVRAESAEKIKAAELKAESAERDKDRQLELIVEQIAEHIWSMRLQGQKELSFEQLKAELAETVINARSKERSDVRKHALAQAAPPPTEPVGKAPPGQAFAR